MSIPFSGALSKSGGLSKAIYTELRKVNLKPVKKIAVRFDPFDERVEETRYLAHYLSTPKVLATNPACKFKIQVLCDRTEPTIKFDLVEGRVVEFNGAHLSAIEMLKLVNKHITALVPKEDIGPVTQTKASKKPGARK